MNQRTSQQERNKKYYDNNKDKVLARQAKYRAKKNGGKLKLVKSILKVVKSSPIEVDTSQPTLTINHKMAKNFCRTKKGCRDILIGIKDQCTKKGPMREYISKGEYYQIPRGGSKRDALYICGPNQCGKTTYIDRYLEQVMKGKERFFRPQVYLFSKIVENNILDKYHPRIVNPHRFDLTENTLGVFRDCIVIFDDVDQYHEKDVQKKIYDCINEILCNGAHFNITILVTNHNLYDSTKTRTILNECTSITVFPKSGCNYQLDRILRSYIGMDQEQLEKLKKLPSRWVTISKSYPQSVMYNGGVYLL